MNIAEKIKPFLIVTHESSTSLILTVGEYKVEVFAERANEGFEGNGYDWASLAQVFLQEKLPELDKKIRFDPEGDMFCAYSENKEAIETFAIRFHAMCEDTQQIRDFFSRAEID